MKEVQTGGGGERRRTDTKKKRRRRRDERREAASEPAFEGKEEKKRGKQKQPFVFLTCASDLIRQCDSFFKLSDRAEDPPEF